MPRSCKNPGPCNATFLPTSVHKCIHFYIGPTVSYSVPLLYCCYPHYEPAFFFCPGTSHVMVAYTKIRALLPSFCHLRLGKTVYSNFYPLHLYSSVRPTGFIFIHSGWSKHINIITIFSFLNVIITYVCLASLSAKLSDIQGEHKVFPWLQTFITRKLRGIQTFFLHNVNSTQEVFFTSNLCYGKNKFVWRVGFL
jgi:hypothetical protein